MDLMFITMLKQQTLSIIVDWDGTRLANGEIRSCYKQTDYEEDVNETKRQIFLLDKIFLKDIVVAI